MAWRIEPLTFRLGAGLQKKVKHFNYSATKDATWVDTCMLIAHIYLIVNIKRLTIPGKQV